MDSSSVISELNIATYLRIKPFLHSDTERSRSCMEKSSLYGRDDGWIDYTIDTVSIQERREYTDYSMSDDGDTRDVLKMDVPPDAHTSFSQSYAASTNQWQEPGSNGLTFEFNKVFDSDSTQEQIFENVAKLRIDDVLNGVNCTIFAYGQTGSGKVCSCCKPIW